MQNRNNIVFEKKHHYVNILRDSDALKVILEKEREENGDESVESLLRTVYKMRNIAFAGLVKEGMQCFMFKDLEVDDAGASIVGMIIDGHRYDCRALVLDKTLKEEYGEAGVVSAKKDGNITKPEKAKEPASSGSSSVNNEAANTKITEVDMGNKSSVVKPVHNLAPEKVDSSPKAEKEDGKVIKEVSQTPDKAETVNIHEQAAGHVQKKEPEQKASEIPPESTITIKKPQSAEIKTENKPISKEQNLLTEIEIPQKEESNKRPEPEPEKPFEKRFVRPDEAEKEKHIESMVFDMIDVGIIQKNNNKGEYVNFTIVPLEISKKDKAISDIFVCMETNDKKEIYSSESNGRKTVTTSIGEYEFIIKGSWKDQKFLSTIYPKNQMTTDEYVKNESRQSFLPSDAKVIGFGHNVTLINEKSGGVTKVHVAPLDLENDEKGIVNVMVCIENSVGERALRVSDGGMASYETDEYTTQIMGFWKGKTFISNVIVTNK